jgi:3-keto-5-aminohexanoate cleavage enzyme
MSTKSNVKRGGAEASKSTEMTKLVITATTANSWIHPNIKNWAQTTDDLVKSAIACYEAGAAILHIHLPKGEEADVVNLVRDKAPDAIIQCGMSSFHIEMRNAHFSSGSDMLSIILNHHDEAFPTPVRVLHELEELEQYCTKCKKVGIRPEWEVWHMGSFWNLNQLIAKGLLDWCMPQILTFFFNWPGGTWSPPTVDEYLHRAKYMPPNCTHTVSIMGSCAEQMRVVAAAINNGGNIRVGTEDNPFLSEGKPARDNAEIIAKFARLSRDMGRDVADASEARKLLKISTPPKS